MHKPKAERPDVESRTNQRWVSSGTLRAKPKAERPDARWHVSLTKVKGREARWKVVTNQRQMPWKVSLTKGGLHTNRFLAGSTYQSASLRALVSARANRFLAGSTYQSASPSSFG